MSTANIGAVCFGLVMGWITYRSLRRREGAVGLSDVASIFGAVGGAAATALFKDPPLFGCYSIGLAIGFFSYFVIALLIGGKSEGIIWMGNPG